MNPCPRFHWNSRKCQYPRLGLPLPLLAGLGLTVNTLLGLCEPALAQAPLPKFNLLVERSDRQTRWLYVDPDSGDDRRGTGNALAPWKTITQALRVAEGNTVIVLAPGTYSADSGEIFPLRLKPGITLQGDPSTRGEEIEIRGGGVLSNATANAPNVTMAAADETAIVGVTVTNSEGYGLWIESASPRVISNTFRENRQDGISIGGNSAPLVQGNYFSDNRENGIAIAGTARPDVRDNVFKETGTGIYITQNARPLAIGNQIVENEDGVVVQQNGQPILRGNLIADNDRYGVAVMAGARANLGTPDDPGGNMIRDNGEEDLLNASAQVRILAFGNQLEPDRTEGSVDFDGGRIDDRLSPARGNARYSAVSPPESGGEFGQGIPLIPNRTIALANAVSPKAPLTTPEVYPPNLPENAPPLSLNPSLLSDRDQPLTLDSLPSPNLSVGRTRVAPTSPQNPRSLPSSPGDISALRVPPPPPNIAIGQPRSVSELVPSLGPLPVPDPNAPIGNSGEVPVMAVAPPSSSYIPGNSPPPPQLLGNFNRNPDVRYRVVVEASTTRSRALVRSISPEAFDTNVNGRSVMQVGAFQELPRANALLEELLDLGLEAQIEEYDR